MQLSHFSNDPVKLRRRTKQDEPSSKPTGFWVSVDGPCDWPSWCIAEEYSLGSRRHAIALRRTKRVLVLDSVDAVVAFTEEYRAEPPLTWIENSWTMDWAKLANRYAGIIIAPYQYTLRHDSRTRWYYTWDCASGCIWDTTVIKSVEQVQWKKPRRRRSTGV